MGAGGEQSLVFERRIALVAMPLLAAARLILHSSNANYKWRLVVDEPHWGPSQSVSAGHGWAPHIYALPLASACPTRTITACAATTGRLKSRAEWAAVEHSMFWAKAWPELRIQKETSFPRPHGGGAGQYCQMCISFTMRDAGPLGSRLVAMTGSM